MPRMPRPITFTCSWCYREVTEDRMPGPTPQYCQGCADKAKRRFLLTPSKRCISGDRELSLLGWTWLH